MFHNILGNRYYCNPFHKISQTDRSFFDGSYLLFKIELGYMEPVARNKPWPVLLLEMAYLLRCWRAN